MIFREDVGIVNKRSLQVRKDALPVTKLHNVRALTRRRQCIRTERDHHPIVTPLHALQLSINILFFSRSLQVRKTSAGCRSRYLSLHFNSHFPGGSGLDCTKMSPFWNLLELRMMEVVVITGAISRAKLQSNHHHQQTNTQFFYRPDALPVAQPTVSEH